MNWPASTRGMWHSTQRVRGDTGQGVPAASARSADGAEEAAGAAGKPRPVWQVRQTASYDARSADARAWGSWQVTQLKAPPLSL